MTTLDLSKVRLPHIRVYLDLDGVVADFDGHFCHRFGIRPSLVEDAVMWRWIHGDKTFFRGMPAFPGARTFYNHLKAVFPNIAILTACPAHNYTEIALHKKDWVAEHLGDDITVLPVRGGTNKHLFMHKAGDLLIDDFEKNCAPWRARGGVAITHRDIVTTRRLLGLGDAV